MVGKQNAKAVTTAGERPSTVQDPLQRWHVPESVPHGHIWRENRKTAARSASDSKLKDAESKGLQEERKGCPWSLLYSTIEILTTISSKSPPGICPSTQDQYRLWSLSCSCQAQELLARIRTPPQEVCVRLIRVYHGICKTSLVVIVCSAARGEDGPAKFRFTVDLRRVNKLAQKPGFLLPNSKVKLHYNAGLKLFAKFDLSPDTDSCLLTRGPRESQLFVILSEKYTPTPVCKARKPPSPTFISHWHPFLLHVCLPPFFTSWKTPSGLTPGLVGSLNQ